MMEKTNGYIRLINCIISAEKENRYKKTTGSINKNIQNIRKMSTTAQMKGRITV